MENKKSPTRTFFILHRETILEAPPRFELGIKVLQTFALPLGYSADWSGLRGSNSLPPPWQGGALPDELNPLTYMIFKNGGNYRARTCDPLLVRQMLSQLS